MKRLLISMTVLALLVVPQFALGSDLDDLKAASKKATQAWSNLDAEAFASMVYPGMVNYGRNTAFPNVAPMEHTQTILTQILKNVLSNIESVQINPYNMQYRVIGNIGLEWGHGTNNIKRKGEPAKTVHVRITNTWIKSDGKWYILTNHISDIPSGD